MRLPTNSSKMHSGGSSKGTYHSNNICVKFVFRRELRIVFSVIDDVLIIHISTLGNIWPKIAIAVLNCNLVSRAYRDDLEFGNVRIMIKFKGL